MMERLGRIKIPVVVLTVIMLALACWSVHCEGISAMMDPVAPVATMATAVLTLMYVALTAEMVTNMVASSREETRPYVVVDFQFDPDGMVSLIVTNLGRTAATNITLEFSPELIGFEGENLSRTLFSSALMFMPPNRVVTQLIGQGHVIVNDDERPGEYAVAVSYGRVGSTETYREEFVLSFKWYRNRRIVRRKGLHEIGGILDKMAKTLEKRSPL